MRSRGLGDGYKRQIKLMENASSEKSETEKFMTRFARYYTPAVVLAAVFVFLIPTILGFNYTVWLRRALIFLVVSCPCALVISIPLTYYIGIGKAAKKGIIFKGSVYLDLLSKVKTLIFDKTGTLTTGELRIAEIEAASLPRVLGDVDAAVINGNYALPAGLSAAKDGLFIEGKDSPYVNIVTVKAGNENNPRILALVKALKSQKIKDYIIQKYPDGDVVPVF